MADPPITERHLPHFHRRAPQKEACRVATTANITISTALNNGDSLDGITLATGDRVLVKNQSTDSQNGLYVVGATPVRAYDLSTDDPSFGFLVFVREGTANGGKLFKNTNTAAPTVGSTTISFAEFSSGGLTDPMTTRGDIIVRNASNVTDRLAVGSAHKVFHTDGTDPSWQKIDETDFAFTDVTTADASTSQHGLLKKLPGGTTTFLRGDGSFATVTGGGGTGLSFIGYDTIGGTWTGLTALRCYFKKVTISALTRIDHIDIYLRPNTDNVCGLNGMIVEDNSNAPGKLIAGYACPSGGFYLSNSSSMPGAGRWVSLPVTADLAAGDYWIGFMPENNRYDIANDSSGSDQAFTASLFIATGAYPSAWTITDSTLKYSIRAAVLS